MLLITANLDDYRVSYPADAVVRINLAWIPSIEELDQLLGKIQNDIFLDHPIGRIKPPAHFYELDELKPIIDRHPNVKYIAVSNVETPKQLEPYQRLFPDLIVAPKIETVLGVHNLRDIIGGMNDCMERVVMIDHDDLLQSLIKNNIKPAKLYSDYVEPVAAICKEVGVIALRTKGVVFSD